MSGIRAASRYAKAFIDLSIERNALEKAYADMTMIVDFCKENHDFAVFLKSPVIKTAKKQAIITQVLGGLVDKTTADFLQLITAQNREIFLIEIANEFINQYKSKNNILTAVVTSATGIDDSIRKEIIALVKQVNTTKVILDERINKALIGGLIVRVGDRQVDASIARKLSDLRRTFQQPSISQL
jgi:F-type H+-transporting ATPase subunit delta